MKHLISALAIAAVATAATAGDDPSIQGELRSNIQKAMTAHMERNTIDGQYVIYDSVVGELKLLAFAELHKGIVKKGSFFVSCADFNDADGSKYDLDFLVARKADSLHVLQALVHSIDGKKRPYHLEAKQDG